MPDLQAYFTAAAQLCKDFDGEVRFAANDAAAVAVWRLFRRDFVTLNNRHFGELDYGQLTLLRDIGNSWPADELAETLCDMREEFLACAAA